MRKWAILERFWNRKASPPEPTGLIFGEHGHVHEEQLITTLGDKTDFLVISGESDYYFTKEGDEFRIEKFPKVRGKKSKESLAKGKRIKAALTPKFFDAHLREAIESANRGENPLDNEGLTPEGADFVKAIYANITGEKGRALYLWSLALSSIKEVAPSQDLRLHKPTVWRDAVSMRTISAATVGKWFINNKSNVTVNPFGPAMTRSFAVNIPWIPCWPENIEGPRDEWLELINELHYGRISAPSTTQALLYLDHLGTGRFEKISREVRASIENHVGEESAINIIQNHISDRQSGGAALLEVAIHSLMQCAYETGLVISCLGECRVPEPIKPMRSADRKAGGVGDIQFQHSKWKRRRGQRFIEYAVDAKHGILEIRDEILRLLESVTHPTTPQPHLNQLDFVGLDKPSLSGDDDTQSAIKALSEEHAVTVRTLSLEALADEIDPDHKIRFEWLGRYASMLMKEDSGYGVMTEITHDWLDTLGHQLGSRTSQPVLDAVRSGPRESSKQRLLADVLSDRGKKKVDKIEEASEGTPTLDELLFFPGYSSKRLPKWQHKLLEGKLARAPRPGYDSKKVPIEKIDEWVAAAKEMGIRTIICHLSRDGDDDQLAYYDDAVGDLIEHYKSKDFDVVHIPQADKIDGQYQGLTEDQKKQAAETFAKSELPVLVHCSAGVTRTGDAIRAIVTEHFEELVD